MQIDRILSNFAYICGLKTPAESGNNFKKELGRHINQATNAATPVAELLPYSYFDEEHKVVFNKNGTLGFWYEISPLVGSSESIEKNLTLFFNDELPEGAYLQFLIMAGHEVGNILGKWEEGRRFGGERIENITAYRKWFIERCSKDFAASSDGRLARDFRTFVTYSCHNKNSSKAYEQLLQFQKKLENKLKTEKLSPRLMGAENLISVARSMLQMQLNNGQEQVTYNKFNSLSDQICFPLTPMIVEEERINHEVENLDSRLFYVQKQPESFSLAAMICLLGSEDKSIPARFVISYTLANNLGAAGEARLLGQGRRSIHAAEKEYTRHDIGAREEAREWREIINIHKKGGKIPK